MRLSSCSGSQLPGLATARITFMHNTKHFLHDI